MAEHQVVSADRAARGRVLLVDDDQDMVELVNAILTDEGYDVTAIAEHERRDQHDQHRLQHLKDDSAGVGHCVNTSRTTSVTKLYRR